MKMITILSCCIMAILPFSDASASASRLKSGPASATAVQTPSSEIGRFQLFQGEYTTFDLKRKETYTHQGVFLLDTATGKVKRYINKIDEDGIYIETWVPTELSSPDKNRTVTAPDKEGKK